MVSALIFFFVNIIKSDMAKSKQANKKKMVPKKASKKAAPKRNTGKKPKSVKKHQKKGKSTRRRKLRGGTSGAERWRGIHDAVKQSQAENMADMLISASANEDYQLRKDAEKKAIAQAEAAAAAAQEEEKRKAASIREKRDNYRNIQYTNFKNRKKKGEDLRLLKEQNKKYMEQRLGEEISRLLEKSPEEFKEEIELPHFKDFKDSIKRYYLLTTNISQDEFEQEINERGYDEDFLEQLKFEAEKERDDIFDEWAAQQRDDPTKTTELDSEKNALDKKIIFLNDKLSKIYIIKRKAPEDSGAPEAPGAPGTLGATTENRTKRLREKKNTEGTISKGKKYTPRGATKAMETLKLRQDRNSQYKALVAKRRDAARRAALREEAAVLREQEALREQAALRALREELPEEDEDGDFVMSEVDQY